MTWFGFVVVALATYRCARIVAVDTLTDNLRASLYEWAWDDRAPRDPTPRAGPWRTYVYGLVSCPLCIGVWIAAGLYVCWRWSGSPAVRAGIVVLAIAGVQCFLASRTDA